MRRLLLFAQLAVVATAITLAQGAPPVVVPALPFPPMPVVGQPPLPVICTGEETPCDAARPWMRGRVEKFCGTARQLAKYKKDLGERGIPEDRVKPCACKHVCNPADPNAAMTDGRAWDGKCETRCNPKNCICPHPCDS